MRRTKVRIDFIKIPTADKIEFARNTVMRMTNNPDTPSPDVPIGQITVFINNLETAFAASSGGGKSSTKAVHDTRKVLDELLRKQAAYVNRIANGNEGIIAGTGFHTTKQPRSANRPDFLIKHNGNEGEIFLKHKASHIARSWVWQYYPNTIPQSEDIWKLAGVTVQAKYTVKGLTPGTRYWFRAAPVTIEGIGAWCNPISQIAI